MPVVAWLIYAGMRGGKPGRMPGADALYSARREWRRHNAPGSVMKGRTMTKGTQYTILVGLLIFVIFGAFFGIAIWAGAMSR